MSAEHLMEPPEELVEKWLTAPESRALEILGSPQDAIGLTRIRLQEFATQAARWGADQQLEACLQWIQGRDWTWTSGQLRAAMRPKPPSDKERCIALLNKIQSGKQAWQLEELDIIRATLETLPND